MREIQRVGVTSEPRLCTRAYVCDMKDKESCEKVMRCSFVGSRLCCLSFLFPTHPRLRVRVTRVTCSFLREDICLDEHRRCCAVTFPTLPSPRQKGNDSLRESVGLCSRCQDGQSVFVNLLLWKHICLSWLVRSLI